MDTDRRQYPRFKKDVPVIIHRPYSERRTETADISLGGVAIYNAQRYYDIGQELAIEIVLEDEDSVFCSAVVTSVYPRSKDASAYKVNLQFLDIPDADKERLKSFIERS